MNPVAPSQQAPKRSAFWKQPRFWLGIASSTLFLWLALRQLSWPRFLLALPDIQWAWIFAGLFFLTLAWLLFALRWQILLAPGGPVPLIDTFSCILVGYLGNAVLPVRLGDVGRIVLLSRKRAINAALTSATVVLERVLDVLTLVLLASLLIILVPVPDLIRRSVQAVSAVFVTGFLLLALLSRSRPVLLRLEAAAARCLPQQVVNPLFALMERFVEGLQATTSLWHLFQVASLSALSWFLAATHVFCLVQAFQLPVPWQASLLVLIVTNLGGAIPSSPGAIGVYEFLGMAVLSTWIQDPNVAASFVLVSHATALLWSVSLGLLAMWREGIHLSTIAAESRGGSPTSRETSEVFAATSRSTRRVSDD